MTVEARRSDGTRVEEGLGRGNREYLGLGDFGLRVFWGRGDHLI